MKILIVSPNDNTGGTERVASIYFKALTLNKNEVRICSIFKPLNSYGISPCTENSDCLHLAKRIKQIRPFILRRTKEEVLKQLNKRVISCKDVTFRIFGFSLTSVNIILSLIFIICFANIYLKYEKKK